LPYYLLPNFGNITAQNWPLNSHVPAVQLPEWRRGCIVKTCDLLRKM
jgi:hypothetical protein